MAELTDNQIVDLLRYSDTKFGGRTFQEADRDHAFPRFWRAAYCEMYRRSQGNPEIAPAALDALTWLRLFQSADAVRLLGSRAGVSASQIEDNAKSFARCVAEMERIMAPLECKERK